MMFHSWGRQDKAEDPANGTRAHHSLFAGKRCGAAPHAGVVWMGAGEKTGLYPIMELFGFRLSG